MPVYAGAAYQRGHGLGRVMKNIFRQTTPLLKQAGRQALKTGISVVASGILGKRPRKAKTKAKTSPKRRLKRGVAAPASQKRRLKRMGFSPLNRDIFSNK